MNKPNIKRNLDTRPVVHRASRNAYYKALKQGKNLGEALLAGDAAANRTKIFILKQQCRELQRYNDSH